MWPIQGVRWQYSEKRSCAHLVRSYGSFDWVLAIATTKYGPTLLGFVSRVTRGSRRNSVSATSQKLSVKWDPASKSLILRWTQCNSHDFLDSLFIISFRTSSTSFSPTKWYFCRYDFLSTESALAYIHKCF